ncbi:PD-(D/E)XK nuclease family protein [Treponema primitia]
MSNNYEPLIKQIYGICKLHEEIARISGENFNIFEILNLSTDELKHSKFIATLLDPKGAHGQGEIFLKCFLNLIDKDVPSDDDLKKIEVDKEFSIESGRIDILLHSDKFEIINENKIYANDQPKQLSRYNDYLSKYKTTKKNQTDLS